MISIGIQRHKAAERGLGALGESASGVKLLFTGDKVDFLSAL